MQCAHLLLCPICGSVLTQEGNMLKCSDKHTFDIAREGYVNLLRKPLPGDTKEMLVARRAFLERGFYHPLAEILNEQVNNYFTTHTTSATLPNILDAGCGEGYYLGSLQQALREQTLSMQGIGLDISKEAIRMAAKKYRDLCFVIANLKEQFPVADQAVDIILNIFAPRNSHEFARVLKPEGILLVVIPGNEHLQQIRTALQLLGIEENKQQQVVTQLAGKFDLVAIRQLHYKLYLHRQEIERLVMMTPNYWHLSAAQRTTMAEIEEMEITAEFVCLMFKRQ